MDDRGEPKVHFTDGAVYEWMMDRRSRMVSELLLIGSVCPCFVRLRHGALTEILIVWVPK